MKILIVNFYKTNEEGSRRFEAYAKIIEDIFLSQTIFPDTETQIYLRNRNNLEEVLYELGTQYSNTKSLKFFQNFDFIFAEGELTQPPWHPMFQKALILLRMCVTYQKRAFFSGGMGNCVIYLASNKIIGNMPFIHCGKNAVKLLKNLQEQKDKIGMNDYLIESTTGDVYQMAQKDPGVASKECVIRECGNIGIHKEKDAEDDHTIGKFVLRSPVYRDEQLYGEKQVIEKLGEELVYFQKSERSHYLLAEPIPMQIRVDSSLRKWNVHPFSIVNQQFAFKILGDSSKSFTSIIQLLNNDAFIVTFFYLNPTYTHMKTLLKNYILSFLSRLANNPTESNNNKIPSQNSIISGAQLTNILRNSHKKHIQTNNRYINQEQSPRSTNQISILRKDSSPSRYASPPRLTTQSSPGRSPEQHQKSLIPQGSIMTQASIISAQQQKNNQFIYPTLSSIKPLGSVFSPYSFDKSENSLSPQRNQDNLSSYQPAQMKTTKRPYSPPLNRSTTVSKNNYNTNHSNQGHNNNSSFRLHSYNSFGEEFSSPLFDSFNKSANKNEQKPLTVANNIQLINSTNRFKELARTNINETSRALALTLKAQEAFIRPETINPRILTKEGKELKKIPGYSTRLVHLERYSVDLDASALPFESIRKFKESHSEERNDILKEPNINSNNMILQNQETHVQQHFRGKSSERIWVHKGMLPYSVVTAIKTKQNTSPGKDNNSNVSDNKNNIKYSGNIDTELIDNTQISGIGSGKDAMCSAARSLRQVTLISGKKTFNKKYLLADKISLPTQFDEFKGAAAPRIVSHHLPKVQGLFQNEKQEGNRFRNNNQKQKGIHTIKLFPRQTNQQLEDKNVNISRAEQEDTLKYNVQKTFQKEKIRANSPWRNK